MAIFSIIAMTTEDSSKLQSAVASRYKDSHLQLGATAWLVVDSGTAKEVSDKLGVTDGSSGSAVIVEVASYYGRASNNIWAWIKNKWESKGG